MIKNLKHLSLLLFIALLAMACRNDKDNAPLTADEPVNLTISLKVPRIELSRGVSDDPRNENNTWTDWQKLVDGRYLYHVSLFLIEKTSGSLVAYRNIKDGATDICSSTGEYGLNGFSTQGPAEGTGTEVTLNFLYDHPMHGDIEKLRRGEFLLMAVANHSAYNQGTYSYSGLGLGEINSVFDADKGIVNFYTSEYYTNLMNFTIQANEDNLCDKDTPQPLTLMQEIALNPGFNQVSCELKRTYSRVRIEIMNNSGTNPLEVKGFEFSTNFAQKKTYLFIDPNDDDRQFTDGFDKDAPVVTSTSAITPYNEEQEIASSASLVLFDGYILESMANTDEPYTYSLNVAYEGESYYKIQTTVSSDAITTINGLTDTDSYYLIKNIRSGKYIYENEGELYQTSSYGENSKINPYALWKLESGNWNNQYYIQNYGSSAFVGNAPGSNSAFTTVNSKDVYFTFSNKTGTNAGIQMAASKYSSNKNYIYMNDNNGSYICSYSVNDNGNGFAFIPVTIIEGEQSAEYIGDVTLTTIDPTTAHVRPVTSINRNDFIDVLITTSYTKGNEKGHFTFVVAPWQTGGGEIEFN